MKVGDLVIDNSYGDDHELVGVIIGWARLGGPDPNVWEVLWRDGEIELALESELELASENR
tara:strand:- start:520 stop:702 length:183 start_codon:yes stop_codon:yes gene_type:complete